MTLVCVDNQHVPAHRAVLCGSSSFLKELLYDSQQQRTCLYLGKVHHEDLKPLLEFMYVGACSVLKKRLENVVWLATELEVTGFLEAMKIYQESMLVTETSEMKESSVLTESPTLVLQYILDSVKLAKKFEVLHQVYIKHNPPDKYPMTFQYSKKKSGNWFSSGR